MIHKTFKIYEDSMTQAKANGFFSSVGSGHLCKYSYEISMNIYQGERVSPGKIISMDIYQGERVSPGKYFKLKGITILIRIFFQMTISILDLLRLFKYRFCTEFLEKVLLSTSSE